MAQKTLNLVLLPLSFPSQRTPFWFHFYKAGRETVSDIRGGLNRLDGIVSSFQGPRLVEGDPEDALHAGGVKNYPQVPASQSLSPCAGRATKRKKRGARRKGCRHTQPGWGGIITSFYQATNQQFHPSPGRFKKLKCSPIKQLGESMSGVAQFLYPKFSMQWGYFLRGGRGERP